MAINPSLLVSAAVLQLYFVDKDTGTPLSDGTITFYQDNARTFLKNIYYQTGVPGNYVYLPAPNPMTLSAVGTPQDDNGNDILLFYYPFDENDSNIQQLYFVTTFNSNAAPQWTRSGFPFESLNSPTPTSNPTLNNVLVNNVFWRNVGSVNIAALNTVLAPGAHEGLTNPDIRYIKDVNDGTDVITFTKFAATLSTLANGAVTPEYYLNFNSTVAGSSTTKVVQFPINLHILSLTANTQYTVALWAQNVAGNVSNNLQIYLYQFLGTGVASPAPILITPQITVSNTWTRYVLNTGVFPTGYGSVLSGAGYDAYYLQIAFPTGTTTDINFTQPELYLGSEAATNGFQSYDEINSIVSCPRTGDIRTSLNTFSPFGWVPMNDGTIGDDTSGASTRHNIDTFQLYSTIWNNVSNANAPVSTGRGASAYADFIAHKTIALTKTLGRALASVGAPSSGTNTGTTWVLGQTTGNENVTIATANLPSHTHSATTGSGGQFVETGGTNNSYNNTGANAGQNFDRTGDVTGLVNSAMTTQPPETFVNVFIKL